MKNLDGKNAVVTGAARGIGFAIADVLASRGSNVAILDLKAEDAQGKAAELSEKYGVKAVGYACDVSSFDGVAQVFKQIAEEFGSIEILVNNAGITRDNLLMRMKENDWDMLIDINLKSVFNTVKAVIRPMLRQKYGRIVNMASINGIVAQPGQANYAASKAGVIGITKSMAKEFATKGVTVNAVAPGFIQTEMTKMLSDEQVDAIKPFIPMGELGQPEDVAKAIAFLVSDEATYITGQVLGVDGGMGA